MSLRNFMSKSLWTNGGVVMRTVRCVLLAGAGLNICTLTAARGADAASPPSVLNPLQNVQPEQNPTTNPSEELGPAFNSTIGGISIRPPMGMELMVRLDQTHLAQWRDKDNQRNWYLVLSRIVLQDATPLTTERHFGQSVKGLLEMTLDSLQNALPGARILRNDLTNLAGAEVPGQADADNSNDGKPKPNVGLIVARYTAGGVPQLKQQALIRGNDHLYYLVEFTTPGSKAVDQQSAEDPGEREAVTTFQKVLDNVRLLDTSKVREEQEKRLYATRAFLTNLTPGKLRRSLVPEQWFRILIHGKDVGYTYVMEQLAGGLPEPDEDLMKRAREGKLSDDEKSRPLLLPRITPGDDILVGVKSRVIIDGPRSNKSVGPIQTDSESWMFVTADRKHEDWSRLIVQHEDTRKKDAFSEELGTSDQHLVGLKSGATLTVTQDANAINLPPINQEVPPFYLPSAIAHLLPRLFDVREQKQYAFASFVGEQRDVVMRYVEVGPAQDVELDGVVTKVIPITDRIGFDGPPTLHYLAADPGPDGHRRYLGSENKQTGTMVLASDFASIQKIWATAGNAHRAGQPPAPTQENTTPSPSSALINPQQ
jgi:hypothetical protein